MSDQKIKVTKSFRTSTQGKLGKRRGERMRLSNLIKLSAMFMLAFSLYANEAAACDTTCITATLGEHVQADRVEQKDGTRGQGYYTKNTDDFLGESSDEVVSLAPAPGALDEVTAYYSEYGYQLVDFFFTGCSQNHYALVFMAPCGCTCITYVQIDDWTKKNCDSDCDGLPDVWEESNLGSMDGNGQTDSDGDGSSDLIEYLAGTNPKDASESETPKPGNYYVYDALGRLKRTVRQN